MKINNLVVGKTCEITLVVKSASSRETRNKKPFLVLEMYDGTDTITANYWDWVSGNMPAVNSILDVTAEVTEWQGKKQLTVKSMRNNTTMHLADFMPSAGVDLSKVYNDAYELLSNISDDTLRDLTLAVMDELRNSWLTVPGASSIHHAYVGGTLVHCYGVAKTAKAIAETIPEANVDLCVAGGMLHDLGKLFTYKMNGIAIDRTDDGNLYEHVFMGAEFIGNFADSHIDTDNYINMKKLQLLRHIILSHHGSLEFGSPVTPQCIEAYIVSHADGLDAVTEQIRAAARKVPDNFKWTERIYAMNNRAQLTPAYVSYIMGKQEEEEPVLN